MKLLYKIAVILMVLLSMTMSATALESKTMNKENGAAAYAQWSESIRDATKYTYISVNENNDETYIYVDVVIDDGMSFSIMSGSVSTQDDVFDIKKNLNSATLSPVQVTLYDWMTGDSKTVTINAQWNSVGDITKSLFSFNSKFGDYSDKFSEKSTHRDAIATGSIEGQNLGESDFSELVMYRSSSMSMEK